MSREPDWLHLREAASDEAYDAFDRELDREDRQREHWPAGILGGGGIPPADAPSPPREPRS